MKRSPSTPVKNLINIGGASADILHDVGAHTLGDLQKLGAVEVFWRAKRRHHHKVTKVLLYALQGALMDCHWNSLPEEVKSGLLSKVKKLERSSR